MFFISVHAYIMISYFLFSDGTIGRICGKDKLKYAQEIVEHFTCYQNENLKYNGVKFRDIKQNRCCIILCPPSTQQHWEFFSLGYFGDFFSYYSGLICYLDAFLCLYTFGLCASYFILFAFDTLMKC